MAIMDIPIFAMLRTKMQWHQQRQQVLSQNVANADTPHYRPLDLVEQKFQLGAPGPAPLRLARTDQGHLAGITDAGDFANNPNQYQVRPAGNAVNLEDEMMKVAANQMDFQAASALYARGLGLIRTAIGK
jgi:flagellar basal-body rod protein FlgB